MNKKLTKIVGVALGLSMAVGVGAGIAISKSNEKPVYATNYTEIATFDFSSSTPSGSTSTALTNDTIKTLLNNSSSVANLVTSVTGKSGDVYSGKGSGGGSIPQNVLKIGKASGGGSFTFTIGGNYNVSKVTINGHVWKTTSEISVNGSEAQTYSTAQSASAHPFEFELATGTRTITIDVETSAVCASSIVLYKVTGAEPIPEKYSVTYHDTGSTSGSVPTDASEYDSADVVTVAGNTGGLAKTGYTWSGWSLNENGSGTAYGPTYTATYTVATSNINFYPIWVKNVTPLPESGTITITGDDVDGTYGDDKPFIVEESNTPDSEFGFNCTQIMKNNSNLQFKASVGVLYSTTPLSYIRNIVVSGSNSSDAVIKYGTSPNDGCDSTTIGTRNTYFKISNGSGNARYWTIEITYSLEDPASLTGLRISDGLESVKKVYDDGEPFDPTGLVVQAQWNSTWDEAHNVLNEVNWDPEPLTAGTTSVVGTYSFGLESEEVEVTGLTVRGPDFVVDGNENVPANVPNSTNTSTLEGKVNSLGVKYGFYALQTYNSNLEFNQNASGAYIGNNESYQKYIRRIRVTLSNASNFSRITMFKGDSPIPGSSSVTAETNSGAVRFYDMGDDSEYFALKLTTTGTWVQIVKIEVFLGSNAPVIDTVSASIKSGTYYAGNPLSASDFDLTVSWTEGKADTNPTSGFTWTVNGVANGNLGEGNNSVVVTYEGVQSAAFNVVGAQVAAKDVVESTLDTKVDLAYRYSTQENYVTDVLDRDFTDINNGGGYGSWSGKNGTSSAVYSGNSGGGNDSIQIRKSTGSQAKSGIISSSSGGKINKVTVDWNENTNSGRILNVYGKTTAYSSPDDLYSSSTYGTLLGTIVEGTSTELEITGNYNYVAVIPSTGAAFLNSISFKWATTSFNYSNASIGFGGSISKTLWNRLDSESTIVGYGIMLATADYLNGDTIEELYELARYYEDNVDDTFTAVAGKSYSLVNGTSIKSFYNPVSTAPTESGDDYIWYLRKSVTTTNVGLTKPLTAVAFIRTVDDEIIFLDEITKSAAQVAKDMVDADPDDEFDNSYLDGSLANLAKLAN